MHPIPIGADDAALGRSCHDEWTEERVCTVDLFCICSISQLYHDVFSISQLHIVQSSG